MKRLWPILALISLGAQAQEIGALPPLVSFSDLINRPLFSPTRRPAAVIPAATLSAATMRLTGLVADSDGKTVALIKMDQQKGEVRVKTGTILNGWQIIAIHGHGIELVGGGQHQHVGLKQSLPPPRE